MQKIYHKCAALLLAAGLLFPCTTALAQMPEKSSMAVGLPLVDSGLPPTKDNGVVLAVWEDEPYYIEVGGTLDGLPEQVKIQAGHATVSNSIKGYFVDVLWETASVDCTRPGIYDITGVLDSAALSAFGLTNPDGLTAVLTVVVRKRGPIETLSGKLLSMKKTYMQLRLRFPILPDDVTALYLERETKPGVWERLPVQMPTNSGGTPQTNFLEFSPKSPPEQFIVYRLTPPEPQLRLRIEVVGSIYAGISNEVEILAMGNGSAGISPPKPEDKPDNDDDDDGSSGGNRGGSTQGETDRPGKEPPKEPVPAQSGGQKPAAETPASIAVPPKSAPPESGAASAASTEPGADIAQHASSASREPSAQETLASAVEEPLAAEPPPPSPDNGHAGTVAATTTAILVAGAGGIYLFKIRRKP